MERIETCAALVRARSDEPDDCIHVMKARYAELLKAEASAKAPPEHVFGIPLTEWEINRLSIEASAKAAVYAGHAAMGMRFRDNEKADMERWSALAEKLRDPSPAPNVVGSDHAPEELLKLTFAVQHNPNCPSPWLVRLPGKGPIDMLPYGDALGLVRHQTSDILGFGKTFNEAARAARAAISTEGQS